MEAQRIRMLIVDDEALQLSLIRKVIIAMRPHYSIDTTNKPQTALKLLQDTAYDVLLTDIKMPQMDGLEMIQRMRELGVTGVKVVIISGFDEFSYAQRALRQGACDYLLKPLHTASISQVLERLETEWMETSQNAREDVAERERCALAAHKAALQLPLSEKEQALLARVFPEKGGVQALVMEREGGTESLPMEALPQGGPHWTWFQAKGGQAVCLFAQAAGPEAPEAVLRETRSAVEGVRWGIGGVRRTPHEAFLCAAAMLENAAFLRLPGLVKKEAAAPSPDPGEVARAFLRGAAQGLRAQVEAGLRRGAYRAGALKSAMTEALCAHVREHSRLFINQQVCEQYVRQFREEAENAESLEAFWTQCAGVLETLEALTQKNKAAAFRENCLLYIQQHYARNLTLPETAAAFHYNTSYFSAVFSKHFGQPFSRYVNQYRMERAALRLTEKDGSIAQIAREVGIADQAYFNRLFREQYHMSPRRYRQMYLKA